ncbi:MAG: amidohydrolase, partial [Desulfobacterales bacterium]|nr:amidohydrolase [Desulfobacterales bacterium]
MSVSPDIILYNGKIHTMSSQSRLVEAIAIKEERVVSTGSNEDIRSLSDRCTREIDLEGRSVFPGFIDTHMHLETVANGLLNVNLKNVRSINELLRTIKRNIPKKSGAWLTSSWWHPFSQLREKRLPTRFDIDEACPNNPVFLPTVGHIAIANSRALEIAGIRDLSTDPEGGKIDRDSVTGSVTGVLYESAIQLVQKCVPPSNQEALKNKYREVMDACNKFGITSIVTGATTPEELKIWQNLRQEEDMNLRVNVSFLPTGEETPLVPEEEFDSALNELKAFASIDDAFLSLGYIKFILDGGMTLETAAVTKPYTGDSENFGMLTMDQQRLNTLISICNRNHFRVGIHAVGDRAIDAVLEAYEEANKKSSIKDRRFILIHGFLIRPDQIDRASHLGVLVATQNV